VATQEFVVCVNPDPANHAPIITSDPIPSATVGSEYNYLITAVDPDDNQLKYSVLAGPVGLSIDAQKGLVTWNAIAEPLEFFDVTVRVSDSKGGFDDQSYQIEDAPKLFRLNRLVV